MFGKRVIYASLFALLSAPLCGKWAVEEKAEKIHKQHLERNKELRKFVEQEKDKETKKLLKQLELGKDPAKILKEQKIKQTKERRDAVEKKRQAIYVNCLKKHRPTPENHDNDVPHARTVETCIQLAQSAHLAQPKDQCPWETTLSDFLLKIDCLRCAKHRTIYVECLKRNSIKPTDWNLSMQHAQTAKACEKLADSMVSAVRSRQEALKNTHPTETLTAEEEVQLLSLYVVRFFASIPYNLYSSIKGCLG